MAELSDLPKVLEEAGYEREFLRRVGAMTPAAGGVDPLGLEEMTLEVSRVNILARVFYMGRALPREDVEGVLSGALCGLLMEEGLLVEAADGMLRAICAVVPARGFWGLRDFDGWVTGRPLAEDHVLGVGVASALLADLTVRRKGERVLDIGTGQGFQAALAAEHAAGVVGTDVNRRALRLAGLAMRMNGISGVELREGNFFEPVEREKFDLVVSNPPFVIAPPHDLTAMGGRWIGDSFVENLVRRAPEFLREDGWATVLGNWHHPAAEEWLRRPALWLAGRGVDVWIVKLRTDDPRTYAENWLRESASTEGVEAVMAARGRLDEWLDYYRGLNVGAISMGAVIMRKRVPSAGEAANWVRGDALELEQLAGQAGVQTRRLFEGETALRGLREEADILDRRLAVCPSGELMQRLRPEEGQWKTVESVIRQTEGFGFPIGLGTLPAMIVGRLDGKRLAREVVKELATEMKADAAVAYAQTAPFLAKMVRMTHVAVVD